MCWLLLLLLSDQQRQPLRQSWKRAVSLCPESRPTTTSTSTHPNIDEDQTMHVSFVQTHICTATRVHTVVLTIIHCGQGWTFPSQPADRPSEARLEWVLLQSRHVFSTLVRINKPLVSIGSCFVSLSLWAGPHCSGGSFTSSVFSSCALISMSPDLLQETPVGISQVWFWF